MIAIIKNLILATMSTVLLAACASESRVAAKEKPATVVVVRPAPPYAGAIW